MIDAVYIIKINQVSSNKKALYFCRAFSNLVETPQIFFLLIQKSPTAWFGLLTAKFMY